MPKLRPSFFFLLVGFTNTRNLTNRRKVFHIEFFIIMRRVFLFEFQRQALIEIPFLCVCLQMSGIVHQYFQRRNQNLQES